MKRLLPMLLLVFSAQVDAWNPKDLARLKATNECEECDLSGAGLYRSNIPLYLNAHEKPKGIDLSGANLSGANLYKAKLYKVNLKEANLYKTQLYKAYLSRANLEGANLKKAYLYKANLFRAGLKVANLFRADLSRANLTEANLEDALYFETVDTTGAIFCRTVMSDGSTNNSGCSQ